MAGSTGTGATERKEKYDFGEFGKGVRGAVGFAVDYIAKQQRLQRDVKEISESLERWKTDWGMGLDENHDTPYHSGLVGIESKHKENIKEIVLPINYNIEKKFPRVIDMGLRDVGHCPEVEGKYKQEVIALARQIREQRYQSAVLVLTNRRDTGDEIAGCLLELLSSSEGKGLSAR